MAANRVPYLRVLLTAETHARVRNAAIDGGLTMRRYGRGVMDAWLAKRVAEAWGLPATGAATAEGDGSPTREFRVPMSAAGLKAVKHAALDAGIPVYQLVERALREALDKRAPADD